jgi:hypothetical protein
MRTVLVRSKTTEISGHACNRSRVRLTQRGDTGVMPGTGAISLGADDRPGRRPRQARREPVSG